MEKEPKNEVSTRPEGIKPKLELQPYSEAEVWVVLESEKMFDTSEDIYAYLREIAEKLKEPLKEQVDARRIFITQTGKQIRISTGGVRDFKPAELEQIQKLVESL